MHVASAPEVVGSLALGELGGRCTSGPRSRGPLGCGRQSASTDSGAAAPTATIHRRKGPGGSDRCGQPHDAVTVDGAPVGAWDASLGRPEFATRNGTYVVLAKDPDQAHDFVWCQHHL